MTTPAQVRAPKPAKAPVIVTIYSLTGGVGGTMAIANCAALLAAAGTNVLLIDWDLAAPRVHEYLRPFLDENAATRSGGLIELARSFGERGSETDPDVPGHVVPLNTADMDLPGRLDYLPPMAPADLLRRFVFGRGWDDRPPGVDMDAFATALRRSLLATDYDYVLVDVPYGASAATHAATEMLPDVLVAGLRPVPDSVRRTCELARRVHRTSPVVRVVPVLMRVDRAAVHDAEFTRVLADAAERFRWLVPEGTGYWKRVWIPDTTRARHAEELAVLAEPGDADRQLVAAYGRLVAELTGRRVPDDVKVPAAACAAYRARLALSRRQGQTGTACVLAAHEDRVWSDWVEAELLRIGVPLVPPPGPGGTVEADRLIVVGATRPGGDPPWARLRPPPGGEVIALRTARHSSFEGLPVTREIDMRRRGAGSARAALAELFDAVEVGSRQVQEDSRRRFTPRFPEGSVEVRDLPPANPTFVGRRDDLDALRDRLLSPDGRTPYVLYGEPGTGKSQIALEYARRFATDYDQVWWIPAQSEQEARAGLTRVARHLQAEGRRGQGDRPQRLGGDLVRTALDKLGDPVDSPTSWLLIFDNVEALSDIAGLLPDQGGHGHIIVTARRLDGDAPATGAYISPRPADGALEPGLFSREESVALLHRTIPALEERSAERLAALAGDLPLAVALIGAWIGADHWRRQGGPDMLDPDEPGPAASGSSDVSLRERAAVGKAVEAFLDAFEERRRESAQNGDATVTPVGVVLELCLETLGTGRHGRATRHLVELFSFLSPDGISRRLLYSPAMLAALRAADDAFTDSTVLDALLVRVSRLGLMVVDHMRGGQVLMHRLVQGLVRQGMDPDVERLRRAETQRVLAAFCPPDGDVDGDHHRETFVELQRHLHPCGAVESADDDVRRWLAVQVRHLRRAGDQGGIQEGLRLAESLWRDWQRRYGPDDPLVVRMQVDLAHLLLDTRDPGRAADLFTTALSRQRRHLGLRHPATLMTARGRGRMLRHEGAYGEAYEEDTSTWRLMRRVFGDDHPLTVSAAGNLVISQILVGHLQEALERELALQDRLVRVRGHQDIGVLASRVAVGVILRELGRYDEADDELTLTSGVLEDLFPQDEANRLAAQRELALTWLLRPDPDVRAAREVLERILPVYRRTYGDTNLGTLACRVAEAIGAYKAGEHDLAAGITVECREAYRELYRSEHPFGYLAQNNLAVFRRAAHPAEAVELSAEAMEGLAALLDGDHPYLLLAQLNHASLLAGVVPAGSGPVDEAVALLEVVHAGFDSLFGSGHPATRAADENLRDARARASGSEARVPGRFIEWTAPAF